MNIAIPSQDTSGLEGFVEEHFGRARYYTIIEVEKREIQRVRVVETPYTEHGPGDIPNWLKSLDVDVVLALGIGPKAISHFENLGIKVIRGVTGNIRDILRDFLKGELKTIEWKKPEKGHGRHEFS